MDPGEVLDFSSNVSPLPFPPGLKARLAGHMDEIRCLPEVDSLGVRIALGRRYTMSHDQFLVGGGTTEWIYGLPRILRPGKVVVPLPTYSDYSDAASLAGCRVEMIGPWPGADPQENARILEGLAGSASDDSLVFYCNPNNPTGRFIQPEALLAVIRECQTATWVVDESYAPFIDRDERSSLITLDMPPNLVLLRSFSKIYGVPGLRLGYAVGSSDLIARMAKGARPWAVSRLAQVAGEFLCRQDAYEDEVRRYCREEKGRLLKRLASIPFLEPVPGQTHFILLKVRSPWTAADLTGLLEGQGILVRNCANFVGLEGELIRISLRSMQDNDRLIEALRRLATR